ncbi:MAG: nucleoside phosphorylase [Saprospiraceae bacterium]|nr:nucleoside phosphorylase [Saprospiraceae bacterium]
MSQKDIPHILNHKNYNEHSVFLPENLLREARRQKDLGDCKVPEICVLDPDGDLATYLITKGAIRSNCWACYHSSLYTFELDGTEIGIIPFVVGAPYAVLVAEQLFVSGCGLLVSVTSAGILTRTGSNKRFALLTESIRDEGTSYHYLPKDHSSTLSQDILKVLDDASTSSAALWIHAKSWTTDAPYRETQTAISRMQEMGVLCVEMEASALYAFAKAKSKKVVCFAHLTNTMAQNEGDFEKGEHFGSIETLELIREVMKKMMPVNRQSDEHQV